MHIAKVIFAMCRSTSNCRLHMDTCEGKWESLASWCMLRRERVILNAYSICIFLLGRNNNSKKIIQFFNCNYVHDLSPTNGIISNLMLYNYRSRVPVACIALPGWWWWYLRILQHIWIWYVVKSELPSDGVAFLINICKWWHVSKCLHRAM